MHCLDSWPVERSLSTQLGGTAPPKRGQNSLPAHAKDENHAGLPLKRSESTSAGRMGWAAHFWAYAHLTNERENDEASTPQPRRKAYRQNIRRM